MMDPRRTLYDEMIAYTNDMISGKEPVNKMRVLAAKRCLRDLKNEKYIINMTNVLFVVNFIEHSFKHVKGPLRGELFKMEKWQKWIIFNLVGFERRDKPGVRRYWEAMIYMGRKNAKTLFASALAWALVWLDRADFATLYIIATKLDRAKEAFDNILENIKLLKETDNFSIKNSRNEYSIEKELPDGKIRIQALSSDNKNADGLNAPFIILDEIHAYKDANSYYVYRQAMQAYKNKLLLGITTAGNDVNSFCAGQIEYCKSVLEGKARNESYFIFICEADEYDGDKILDPLEHRKANPNYGISINPEDVMVAAEQAYVNSDSRIEFLNKNLNVYVNTLGTYFTPDKFRESNEAVNEKYHWDLKKLSKLKNVKWFGGADLSQRHDLTAVCLYGRYKDIDIAITHAFFPKMEAIRKAREDNIPLFEWEEDGNLTMINEASMEYSEPVKWFESMRDKGFKIERVGFDPKFGREFILKMKNKGFKIVDTPQSRMIKSQGFREIEHKVKNNQFFFLGSEAYLYCVGNVKGIEDSDDFIKFSKISQKRRIDLFDASVMACYELLESVKKTQDLRKYKDYLNKRVNE